MAAPDDASGVAGEQGCSAGLGRPEVFALASSRLAPSWEGLSSSLVTGYGWTTSALRLSKKPSTS
jgi:hypothetical protein